MNLEQFIEVLESITESKHDEVKLGYHIHENIQKIIDNIDDPVDFFQSVADADDPEFIDY